MERGQVEGDLKNMGVKGLRGEEFPVRGPACWDQAMGLTSTITQQHIYELFKFVHFSWGEIFKSYKQLDCLRKGPFNGLLSMFPTCLLQLIDGKALEVTYGWLWMIAGSILMP